MQKMSLSKFLSYWDNSELHGTQGAKGFSVKFLLLLLYLKKCNTIQVRPRGGWIKKLFTPLSPNKIGVTVGPNFEK